MNKAKARTEMNLPALPPVLRFAAIGVTNSAIDFGIFVTCIFVFAFPLVAANVTSYAIAATFSYFANLHWTFAGRAGRPGARSFVAFQLVNLVGLVLATTVLLIAAMHMPVIAAKIVSVGASFMWTFNVLDRLLWRRGDKAPR